MKTFRLDMRLRNNRLITARETRGFASAKAAADALGVSYQTLNDYECLRRSPWSDGRQSIDGWNRSAVLIANAYGVAPESLWPEELGGVRQTHVTMEVDGPGLMLDGPKTPEELLIDADRESAARMALGHVTPRQGVILRRRF